MQGNLLRYMSVEGWGNKARWTADFLITATIAGALGYQARQIASARDPEDMTTKEFWARAMLTGGGLSIVGDFMFGNVNRYGGGLATTFLGPSVGSLDMFRNLTVGNALQAASDESTNFTRELIDFVVRNLPGQNMWFSRAAFDRLVVDQLKIAADPDAALEFRRKERKLYRDKGQRLWWRSGEMLPDRSPDFGAALGQ
jgi:hypothetical protein